MAPRIPRIVPAFLFVLFAVSIFPAASAVAESDLHSQDASLFSLDEYKGNLEHLASDELEGRGTGQPGIDRAAEYIADAFEKYGVKPAGDDDTYFQNFNLTLSRRIGSGTSLAFSRQGRRARLPLVLNDDFRPFPFSTSAAFDGGVVFAGYGIVDDDSGYNDYEDVDVAGKIVLVIRRAPEFAEFDVGTHQTFRAKASHASARRAAAILIVNKPGDDEQALYPFDAATGGFGLANYGIPMMHITSHAADELLRAGRLPGVKSLLERIEKAKKPASAALAGVSVRGEVNIEPVDSPVRNVIGLIPGQGPQADEIIVLGAHYDHLGIRNKDEPAFDPTKHISNGADDNASGTALIMTMARVYTQGRPPNRSILLMLFTAEEIGLLGSAHFAKHPTVDLSRCVAMLNFDMVGRLKDEKLEVGGMRTGGFEDIVEDLGEEYGFKIRDGGGGRGPSDHTSFYNKKIPVLFFFTGIHRQYHRPEDDIHLINYDGALRIARFSADIIDNIDAQAKRPAFLADTRRAEIARQSDGDSTEPPRREAGRRSRRRGAQAAAETRTTGVRLGVVVGEEEGAGVEVAEVAEDSPAAVAGLKPGDRLIRIGKIEIDTADDAVAVLAKLELGDETTAGVVRGGKKLELRVSFAKSGAAVAVARSGADRSEDSDGSSRMIAKEIEASLDRAGRTDGKPGGIRFVITQEPGKLNVRVEASDFKSAGQVVSELGRAIPEILESVKDRDNLDLQINVEVKLPVTTFHLDFSIGESKGESAPKKGKERSAGRAGDDHAHAAESSDETRETMPMVRLGIMPTYGEGEEGVEGYQIDGVIEDGPAAKAGMKDGDRIYMIGGRKVTNVYEYMDSLRRYKSGDEVLVTVIRDGKKLNLKVKASGGRLEAK